MCLTQEPKTPNNIYKEISEYNKENSKIVLNKYPPFLTKKKYVLYENLLLCTFVWEEEGTICFSQIVNNTTIIRRQDTNTVNGTNILHSIDKKKGRIYTNLKKHTQHNYKSPIKEYDGIWISVEQAKKMVTRLKVYYLFKPILTEDPNSFLNSLIDQINF